MSWLFTCRGLGSGLVSASILGATLVPWVAGRSEPVLGEVLLKAPPQQIQFYYTPWGTASIVPTRTAETPSRDDSAEADPPRQGEETSLYHLTKPGPGTAIGDSPAGRKLAEIYESGPNLVAGGTRVYASFTGGAYDLNARQRGRSAGVESAQLNLVPEPSPLALLVTGIACIFFAKGLRRSRRMH